MVEQAVAGIGNIDGGNVEGGLADVKASVDTLEETANAIETAVSTLADDIQAADTNNVAGLDAISLAVANLQAANTADGVAVGAGLADVKASVDAAAVQANADSQQMIAELSAIETLISTGNGDRVTLIAKANDIIDGIANLDSNLVAKMDELLKESDSTRKTMSIDTEIADARLVEKIVTIPSGALTFSAIITSPNASSNQLEWSVDGGATYTLLAAGVGFSTENLQLPGFDIGEYPEFKVKYPLGAYGQVTATNDAPIDVTVEDGAAPAPPQTVELVVTDNGTDSTFSAFAGDYVDNGDVDSDEGDSIYTNGSKFYAVGVNYFYDTLAEAQAIGAGPFTNVDPDVENAAGDVVGSVS